MKIRSLLKQACNDFMCEYGNDLSHWKQLAIGLLPVPLERYHSFRMLFLIFAASAAAVTLSLLWAATGSFSLALLIVLSFSVYVVSTYFEQREKQRKEAVKIPMEFVSSFCKNSARLELPIGLVDVLGLELVGWYTVHNNFFARWSWVEFSIPLDQSKTANLSNPQIAENTLFLLNQYSAGFSKKTQSPPLVIRNLHFSRNSLEFEVILNSNRDAREFLAETKRKTPFAPIDDPDFGTLPSDWRRKNDH